MKKNIALMALTGVIALASCSQQPGDTTAPSVSFDSQTNVAAGAQLTLKGSVSDNVGVKSVTLTSSNGGPTCTPTVSGSTWSCTTNAPSPTASTTYNYTVTASDTATTANTATATGSVQVNAASTPVQTGSLTITKPDAVIVTVKNSAGAAVPSTQFSALPAGAYTITWSQPGYTSQNGNFNIVAGQNTALNAPQLVKAAATAAYVKDGVSMPIPTNAPSSSFKFTAWLENRAVSDVRAEGVDPTTLGKAGARQAASAQELTERAPSGTQNIAAAYMQYTPDNGTTWYPVVGAEVRWDTLPSNLTISTQDPNFNPNELTANYAGYDNPAVIAEIVRRGSLIRFTAADDGSQPTGSMRPLDINDNGMSAFTITNSATGSNVPFPQAASYATYNVTGVTTPNIDGFTWTAVQDQRPATYLANNVELRSPNVLELEGRVAQTQIRAIGYVNGTEIDKVFLEKNFVPAATPHIRKTVISGEDGKVNGSKSFRITIYNDSPVPANDIRVSDMLKDATQAGSYAIRGVRGQRFLSPAGATTFTDANGNGIPDVAGVDVQPVPQTTPANPTTGPIFENAFTLTAAAGSTLSDDGFDFGRTSAARDVVNLPAFSAITLEFDAQATTPGRYCDVATLTRYLDNNLGDVYAREDASRNRLVQNAQSAEACMNIVSEPALAVDKVPGLMINNAFVPLTDPRLQPGGSLETYRRIDPGTPVTLRVTVRNTGTEAINNLVLTDVLTSANAATHNITTLPAGATATNGGDGFTLNIGTLAQGSSRTYDFVAVGNARGRYCDTVTATGRTSTANATISDDASACFSVDIIRFTKVNQVIRAGQLVDAETVNDIAPGELVLTTVTLLNDGETTLSNVRLYDTVSQGRNTGTNFLVYEDRPAIINPLVRNLVNSDGRGFDRVDAYDAKTAILGTLAAAKFNSISQYTATSTPVVTTNVDGTAGQNGRVGQLVAGNNVLPDSDPASGIAARAAIRLIRSDDTVVNAGEYGDFDPVVDQPTPGYILLPSQQLTLRFFSRVPTTTLVRYADTYCNTAWWNYGAQTNTATGESRRYDEVQKCLTVKPLLGFRQNLDDYKFNPDGTLRNDDVFKAEETIRFQYSSTIEPSSTQDAVNGSITIRYGQPTGTTTPRFTIDRGNTVVRIYNAGVNPNTLDPNSAGVGGLNNPALFTVVPAGSYTRTWNAGVLTIDLDSSIRVQPNQTIWVQNDVAAPAGTSTTVEYVSQGLWVTKGSIDNREYTVPTASDNTTITP